MKKVLVTGGSGLIGKRLLPLLKKEGYQTALLSRGGKPTDGWDEVYAWDWKKGYLQQGALNDVTHVIHLAGEGIVEKAWTARRKQELLESRVQTARFLLSEAARQNARWEAFVGGSAVGWYGSQTDSLLHEESEPPAADFLGSLCKEWEEAYAPAAALSERVVIVRTGVVLDADGGALPQMAAPFRLFAGAPLGSGSQQIPWIHNVDLCRFLAFCLSNRSVAGAFNASATTHCTNRAFSMAIGKVLKRPVWPIGVPSFVMKALLGERACIVLEGVAVSNKRMIQTGFTFSFPDLEQALRNLL